MRLRAVLQPVNGTFELRWQGHRGDAPRPGLGEAHGEPSAVSLDAAVPARARQSPRAEPALVGGRRPLDEVATDS
ncbi:MAG TPA: hypothetical protein VE953_09780 [Terriglobales bacterium]|nr:hypothetical protein [Terriglobales bacterium]